MIQSNISYAHTLNSFFSQYDKKGRNYLHRAILSGDVETVLFLISVNANVHIPVQDSSLITPLHLAVQSGSEIIVRHLVNSTNFIYTG